jgi:uncharacterized RDD family membrane protein YckC
MSETTVEDGVYYRREDYAGVWRRLLIEGLDLGVAFAFSSAITVLLLAVVMPEDTDSETYADRLTWILLVVWPGVWFTYLVILKRTRIRTLGYILGCTRIVNLQGKLPGIGALTINLAFATIGPINVVVDLFWMTGDDNRQALRDKLAGTYVIHKDAQPAGRGKIVYRSYSMIFNFLFREVQRPG